MPQQNRAICVYCGQYLPVPASKRPFRKQQWSCRHNAMQDYPLYRSGQPNVPLLTAMQHANRFLYGSGRAMPLYGEYWGILPDELHRTAWLYYVLSEPSANDAPPTLSYLLCPVHAVTQISPAELLAALRQARLFRQWGKLLITPTLSYRPYVEPLASVLTQCLQYSPNARLFGLSCTQADVSFWLSQLCTAFLHRKAALFCFFAAAPFPLEQLEQRIALRIPIPHILLLQNEQLPIPRRSSVFAQHQHRMGLYHEGAVTQLILLANGLPPQLKTALVRYSRAEHGSICLAPDHLNRLINEDDAKGSVASPKPPYLLCQTTQERIAVTAFPFSLGSKPQKNGYQIKHNPTISGLHARLTYQDGHYFLEDCGSKNRTLLNGVILPPGKRQQLNFGAQICLSDTVFLFLSSAE